MDRTPKPVLQRQLQGEPMVVVDVKTRMVCDAPNCTASAPALLVLNAAGGFNAKPINSATSKKWQIGTSSSGVYLCRCPEHHSNVQVVTQ
jgi:hypothetical protein